VSAGSSGFRELLGRDRDFRWLFLAGLVTSAGTALSSIALVLDVYARTGSPIWVSAVLLVAFAPMIVVGLLLGFLMDRLPRRRMMIASDVVRVVVFAALPFAESPLQIVLLALGAGIASCFFGPASYAAVPNLVADEDLPRANGIMQSSQSLTLTAGPLLGAAIVAAAGPGPVYVIDAVSFLVSAILIARIRTPLEVEPAASQGTWRDMVSGVLLVRATPALRLVLVTWMLFLAGSALTNVSEVVLVKSVFDAGDLGFGLAVSASGVGLLIGSLNADLLLRSWRLSRAYALAIGLIALMTALVAIAPSLWVALPLLVLTGIGNAAALASQRTLIQRGTPDSMRGRAVALLMGLGNAVLVLAMAASGPFTSAFGARSAWLLAAALMGAATVAAIVLGRQVTGAKAPSLDDPALDAVGPR
jgi:MFS family permease